jgi:hypothetical protein
MFTLAESPANRRLLESLDVAGYFDGLEPAVVAELRNGILDGGYGRVFGHPWRFFFADDEDVAESGAAKFLADVAPGLEALGVPPLIGEETFDQEEAAQTIRIGGESVLLLTSAEYEQWMTDERPNLGWGLIPARLQRLLNDHLARHGKADRFYASLCGNDASVLILTPAMHEAIIIWFKQAESPSGYWQMPYLRTERWPDFGQPGLETE